MWRIGVLLIYAGILTYPDFDQLAIAHFRDAPVAKNGRLAESALSVFSLAAAVALK
jgi:hypothetical protein